MTRWLLCLSLALGAVGCAPTWTVVRLESPENLRGVYLAVLEPVTFDGLRVGDEPAAEYFARRSVEEQQRFAEGKRMLARATEDKLTDPSRQPHLQLPNAGPAPANAMTLHVNVVEFRPGSNSLFGEISASARIEVTARGPRGVGTEVIVFTVDGALTPEELRATETGRIDYLAERIRATVARFLVERTGVYR